MAVLKLLKIAPMLLMVGVLTYAAYEVNTLMAPIASHPGGRGDGGGDSSLAQEENTSFMGGLERKAIRDPFAAVSNSKAKAGAATEATVDPFPAIIGQLDLSMTFVQGKTQYAVINGRLYHQGVRLEGLPGEGASLVLAKVERYAAILSAGGKSYRLSYPDGLTNIASRRPRPGSRAAAPVVADPSMSPQLSLIRALLGGPTGITARPPLRSQGLEFNPIGSTEAVNPGAQAAP
jgi:hypothetical protein